MKKLFTENIGLKLGSIAIAIILWVLVVYTYDPAATTTFTIGVDIINGDSIASLGKVYEVVEGDTITIKVKANASLIKNLKASDFKATADVSKLSPTDHANIDVVCTKSDNVEITIIGSTINRKGLSGKRFYTAFLLGAILGLRRSDIINLTFSNIVWEHNTISLSQEKTKKRFELPLTKEVGSALIDYLKNERKNDGADKHVFLTLKPPLSKDVGGYTLCRDSNCNMGF